MNGLISYWKLDEVSGIRSDIVGGNDLTDNNTVTQAVGKIGNAAQFTDANLESLSHASNTALQTGDIDFLVAGSVYFDTLPALGAALIGKTDALNLEYWLDYDGTSRLRFIVSSTGADAVVVSANAFGVPSTSTWYHFCGWHDSVANTINIQIDNGTIDTTAHSSGVFPGAGAFRIGAITTGAYHNGRLDDVKFSKRIWTAEERTEAYNNHVIGRSLF